MKIVVILWICSALQVKLSEKKIIFIDAQIVEMNMHWYPLQPDNTTEEIYVSVQFPEVKFLDRAPEYTAIVICEKI